MADYRHKEVLYDTIKTGSPFSVLRSPFSVLRSPFSVSLAGLFCALLILPVTNCSNGSTEQPGSLAGIWYGGPGQTRDEKQYIIRLTATDTGFFVEQNRGIGWSPLVKGTYTETGGVVTAILTHGDTDAGNIADQMRPYDEINPNELAENDMPPNAPMSLKISGNSISWDDLILTRDIYADKLANTIADGTVDDKPAKITTGGDKMWTMTVDAANYLKGVYMMTGAASAKVIITHGYTGTPTPWKFVDDSMSQIEKNHFLPAEGQILTVSGITDTSLTMTIDGDVAPFTITPN